MRGRAMWMALCLLAGCAGGGSLRGSIYLSDEARYRIGELGPGWERLELRQNDLAWRGDDGAIVQVNATCDSFQDVPLTSLTNHLLIGFTARELREQVLVPLDGREALRSHYVASLDGVPRELLLFVLKKDECTFDFALIAPPAAPFGRARPAFERFVAGFTSEPG